MNSIPAKIYLAEQVRELDRIAIEDFKVPGFTLMQRAGEAAYALIEKSWPNAQHILVLAGAGNNGGDGYIVASLAMQANKQVYVIQLGDHSQLKGDAKQAHDLFIKNGGKCIEFDKKSLPECDLIVDALLGTGLTRTVRGDFATIIRLVNQHCAPVLSADIPSGLDANRGQPLGEAIYADATITFVGMKLGLITAAGRKYSGEVYFNDLQIPTDVYELMPATCNKVDLKDLYTVLGKRNANAHKGDYGHVLCIGGNKGFAGSIMLAAEVAARTGSGLVSVATEPSNSTSAINFCREVMVHGVSSARDLDDLLKRATVIAIGPGLGQDQWARNLFERALELDLPLVLDADALNLLSKEPTCKNNWILTPHPGEAARLMQTTTTELQQQRLESTRQLQAKYGGVCVLKGSGTLIASNEEVSICTAGNPGMASGGMGDVLTGIIAGLLAQGLTAYDAARFGVQLHAQSADIVAQDGIRGMLASDLLIPLRKLINAL